VLAFTLRQADEVDRDFLWHAHKAAMKGYVSQTWGWDEAWQQQYFRDHVLPERIQVIEVEREPAGFLELDVRDDCLFVTNLELLPAYQGKGIGGELLRSVQTEAAASRLPVRLQVLRVNPARRLYERLGFRQTGETDTHYQMEWP
jgi:ribosomal protein S18 acetylase RimI-like enzyme